MIVLPTRYNESIVVDPLAPTPVYCMGADGIVRDSTSGRPSLAVLGEYFANCGLSKPGHQKAQKIPIGIRLTIKAVESMLAQDDCGESGGRLATRAPQTKHTIELS